MLPSNVLIIMGDLIFPKFSLSVIFASYFSIRLVNAFKLHDQLNVLVQKLAAGATRKVCVVSSALLGAYVVWEQTGNIFFLHCSCVLC